MKTLIVVLAAISSFQAFASSTSSGSVIAKCLAPADANNPAEALTLYYRGSDRNNASQYTIHYAGGTIDQDFPVQELEWLDNGATLGLRFANYMIVDLHAGKSDNSTIGVALGAAPRAMSCDANF